VKEIEIDFSQPFKRTLTNALALPDGYDNSPVSEENVAHALWCLYTAAHGRAVETPIGRVPIAPAVTPSLKSAPTAVRTRAELVSLAKRNSNVGRRSSHNLDNAV